MIGFTYRIEATADESEHIFVKNQQGDVEKVLRPWDQAVVAEYSYDAWGTPSTGPAPWPSAIPSATGATITIPRPASTISRAGTTIPRRAGSSTPTAWSPLARA